MRVLITEDNGELAAFIHEALRREGFLSDIARSVGELKLLISENQYSAVILDLGLPDGDGMDVLKMFRRDNNMVPILVLTARGGVQDRIKGLDGGADDYLVKPFAIDELIARVKALLRRPNVLSSSKLEHSNIALDLISKTVTVDGKNIMLGKTELAILEYLLRNIGMTVSREALENSIYQNGYELTENALQVAMHRVRKKIKDSGALAEIKTIRGIGYIFK